MWKEIIDIDGFNKLASLRSKFGCAQDIGGQVYLHNIENKIDCHYYQYKSDTIELIKGYKQLGNTINIIAFVIKADIEDYQEAIRLMAEHAKEYISTRNIKILVINYGSTDQIQIQMNTANFGVGKIGFSEVVRIAKIELEKLGFQISWTDKQIRYELM